MTIHPNTCPRSGQCEHRPKLVVGKDGRCVDCGQQITLADPDFDQRPWRHSLSEWWFDRASRRWVQKPKRSTTPDLWELLVRRTAE